MSRLLIAAIAFLAGFGILAFAMDEVLPAPNGQPPSSKPVALPTAMQVLEWLPADTETFVVANGPFRLQLPPEDDKQQERKIILAKLLEELTYGPWNVRKGGPFKKLAGRQVALAVEGARRFRPPSGLGVARYEGGHVLVFRHDLGAAGDALKKALVEAGAKTQTLAGRPALSVEEKRENDVWTFYFAQPKANVLVCATDPGYLTEMLRRLDRPEATRALPRDLPEWKYVDTTARFWALRHSRDDDDGEAGLVFTYTPGKRQEKKTAPTVKCLWDGVNVREVKSAWTYVGEATWKPKVKQLAPGAVEVTAHFRHPDDALRFLFMLLNHLGHAVCV